MIADLCRDKVLTEKNLIKAKGSLKSLKNIIHLLRDIYYSFNNKCEILICQGALLTMIALFSKLSIKNIYLHQHNTINYENRFTKFLLKIIGFLGVKMLVVSPDVKYDFPNFKNISVLEPYFSYFDDSKSRATTSGLQQKPVVSLVGRSHPHKKFHEFLTWFENSTYDDIFVQLITDDIAQYNNYKKIRVLKYEKTNYIDLLFFSNYILSTSKDEGFGLTLIEGMSLGLVPVASNLIGGSRYILESAPYLSDFNDNYDQLMRFISESYKAEGKFNEYSHWAKVRAVELQLLIKFKWINFIKAC